MSNRAISNPVPESSLGTGLYALAHVATTTFAALTDGNNGSPLTQSSKPLGSKIPDDIKWNICHLSNGKYTISNYLYPNDATVTSSPRQGDVVKGRHDQHQWIIKPHKVNGLPDGQYLISPADNELVYWTFSDPKQSPVKVEHFCVELTDSSPGTLWKVIPVPDET
ncbi:hypothetical protein BJ138DRAFT_1105747 [Hygrophoropsis aurantiaca]|uniref:Uncharacterized protein n=1 Tax=Hygrophoropsis aurantiaca TaxID=72124 RepID=A0ACB7ZXQ6_9AGAM|nr:hypothetical protein BJ138DRAFT_1105747 [Hygrophoropsis aurantiaca]